MDSTAIKTEWQGGMDARPLRWNNIKPRSLLLGSALWPVLLRLAMDTRGGQHMPSTPFPLQHSRSMTLRPSAISLAWKFNDLQGWFLRIFVAAPIPLQWLTQEIDQTERQQWHSRVGMGVCKTLVIHLTLASDPNSFCRSKIHILPE